MKKSTSLNFVLSSVLFLVLTFTLNAQLQNANWYFGNQSGLNFNDGTATPTALMKSGMNTTEGCASVSDANGELLFYTDGIDIWKNDHQTVSGSSLYGSVSVSQSVIIVPATGTGKNFYIFTNQGPESGSYGLSYSKLTLKQDDSDDPYSYSLSDENTQLLTHSSEKLTAVFNPADNSYWVIAFAPSDDPKHSDTFYSFKVDEYGITLANKSRFSFLPEDTEYTGGQMKISSDLKNLGLVHNTIKFERDGGLEGIESIFTFDFDYITGLVQSKVVHSIVRDQDNSINLISSDSGFDNVHIALCDQKDMLNILVHAYGFEFSPDGDKFYVSVQEQLQYNTNSIATSYNLFQVLYRNELSYKDSVQIQHIIKEDGFAEIYSLQLGIDGKIYGADNTGFLYRIANPNELGQNVGFEYNAIDLNGKKACKGLPQSVPYSQDIDISVPEFAKTFTIMENPFEEELKIKFHVKKSFNIKLFDISGNRIKNKNFNISYDNQIVELDLDNAKGGIYILVIKDKLTKEKYRENVLKMDD